MIIEDNHTEFSASSMFDFEEIAIFARNFNRFMLNPQNQIGHGSRQKSRNGDGGQT